SDLGKIGSFGGKENDSDEIENDPVIFVHGASDVAGSKMKVLADQYKVCCLENRATLKQSYTPLHMVTEHREILFNGLCIRCDVNSLSRHIRALILAVRFYARRNVDIVAFSLGVPITRKAILGGKNNIFRICFDTKENLGVPLTRYIDTFVGISGPNHGMTFKVAGLPVPTCALGTLPICDKVIGLYSGLCPMESDFLHDINGKYHYEGDRVYSIYSHADEKIGYKVCNKVSSEFWRNNAIGFIAS
ncbi:unnamed protein product, partial [Angiostrongylus costaricensis]|uniref:Lipase domain-containing protein n=1 Tax=Angiostrongylus costaricensis TaxID=334426 RepID=A0A158PJ54_ANGCS